jgi:hypothetical protein
MNTENSDWEPLRQGSFFRWNWLEEYLMRTHDEQAECIYPETGSR